MYYEDSGYGKWEGKWIDTRLFNSSNDVERIEGHVYDYKCNKCCSDRDYNMSDKYNISHPIKEYMGEIMMNGESIHTIKGEKVNQQIENKEMTCKNGKCSVFNLTEESDIDESYNERAEWAWLVEHD